jgi:hypothetical protein
VAPNGLQPVKESGSFSGAMKAVFSRGRATALVVTTLACSAGNGLAPTGSSPDLGAVPLDRDFRLSVGERAEVGDDGLAITLREVPEDSRCPIDVDCVWEGDAAVVLEVAIGRRAADRIALHTTLEPRSLIHGGYEIRLVGLAPAPLAGRPIPAGEYVATLSVRRAG